MSEETRSDRLTLRFLAAPSEVTVSGRAVPAGRVLEWIDKAAYACAVGWSGNYCVTAYVGDVNFSQPILPGELIEVHARIVLTGTSSMHILVRVESTDVRSRKFSHAMSCILVMVAVDSSGKPCPVPEWVPWSTGDETLRDRAKERIRPRRAIQELTLGQEYSNNGTTPRTVFRFLAAPGDANWGGNAHGGTVMRWIDEAAYACAASWSSETAVAVYAGGIHFHRPIHIGDIVEVDARLIHTGPHSMHVSIRVASSSVTSPRDLGLTMQCISVFVDPDDSGKAAEISPLTLMTDEDIRLDAYAQQLIGLRKSLAVIPAGLARES